MGRPCSLDLRELVVKAVVRGGLPRSNASGIAGPDGMIRGGSGVLMDRDRSLTSIPRGR